MKGTLLTGLVRGGAGGVGYDIFSKRLQCETFSRLSNKQKFYFKAVHMYVCMYVCTSCSLMQLLLFFRFLRRPSIGFYAVAVAVAAVAVPYFYSAADSFKLLFICNCCYSTIC